MDFGDRYIRWPLYLMYGVDGYQDGSLFKGLYKKKSEEIKEKFYSFVVSNSHHSVHPLRDRFFEQLNKYKKVDSGGRSLNNIGGPVSDKMKFIKSYKFNIAFENSSTRGYTTEKIVEAMSSGTVPIYFGNPSIDLEFNAESFIWLKSENELDQVIERIIHLDRNRDEYEKIRAEKWITGNNIQPIEDVLLNFFIHIFDQDLIDARRVNTHACDPSYLDKATLKKYLRKQKKRELIRKILLKKK